MWLLASQLPYCPSNSTTFGARIQRRRKLIASVPRGMRQVNEFSNSHFRIAKAEKPEICCAPLAREQGETPWPVDLRDTILGSLRMN